jgi:HEPN domain-containing protein
MEHYDHKRDGPADLLFIYDYNLKILEAIYLLLCNYNNFYYKRKRILEQQLITEKEKWEYFPKNLSLEEQLEPYKAIKKVFKHIKPQEYRDQLHEWLNVALCKNPDVENLYERDIVNVYENLVKLYAAAWLIYQRDGENLQVKQSQVENNIVILPTERVDLRAINPAPSPAEKLALAAIKDRILRQFPSVKMIIHLGSHPKPTIFYLLILIDDNEKTPEHEISNQIEDYCRDLAHVHALVSKLGTAEKALTIGRQFWLTAMDKGIVLYQSADVQLPKGKEITKEIILNRAKFNWERWGKQGNDFLKGAELYRSDNNYRLAAFLLHQSVESVLKGNIQSVIGYPIQVHNLSRLLRLTLLFTDNLKEVFELDATEGAQLFTLLQNAYSQSRFNSSFDPDKDAVRILAERVAKLNDVAKLIYQQFIEDTWR